MEIKQLIEAVKNLDDAQLQEFLQGLGVGGAANVANEVKATETPGEAPPPASPAPAAPQAEAPAPDAPAPAPATEAKAEEAPADAKPAEAVDTAVKDADGDGKKDDASKAGETDKGTTTPTTQPAPEDKAANAGDVTDGDAEEEIPPMVRGVPAPEEADQAPAPDPVAPPPAPMQSDDGKPIPTDFDSIVSGQQARIAALESENAILRQKADKVDAAFGYAARPAEPVRVDNGLYDPAFNVKMHR
jgi:hypothetical protein